MSVPTTGQDQSPGRGMISGASLPDSSLEVQLGQTPHCAPHAPAQGGLGGGSSEVACYPCGGPGVRVPLKELPEPCVCPLDVRTSGPVGPAWGPPATSPLWYGSAQGAGFSGQAPGETLCPDPTFGRGCFPLSLGGAGWEGLSWEAAGVGRPGGLGAGLGEAGSGLTHPPGLAPFPGSLEPSRGCPPAAAQEACASFPSPVSPPLAWTCLWSGRGPWQSQPCGPGSPWLLGPFTLCPWVLVGSPCSLTRTTEVSSHPGPGQHSQTLPPLEGAQERRLQSHSPSRDGGEGSGQGPGRGSPSLSPLWAPSLSAESPCVWEAPGAKPGWMRNHKFTNSP